MLSLQAGAGACSRALWASPPSGTLVGQCTQPAVQPQGLSFASGLLASQGENLPLPTQHSRDAGCSGEGFSEPPGVEALLVPLVPSPWASEGCITEPALASIQSPNTRDGPRQRRMSHRHVKFEELRFFEVLVFLLNLEASINQVRVLTLILEI